MPIYEMQIRGEDKIRLVKAATAAQARDHIVSAKPISAERMGELIEEGATLEKAAAPASDPSSHAQGGELHKPEGPDGSEGEEKDSTGKGGKS